MKILMVNRILFTRTAAERTMFCLADTLEQMGHHVAWFTQENDENQRLPDTYAVSIHRTNRRLQAFQRRIYDAQIYQCMKERIELDLPDAALIWNIRGTLTWAVVDALRDAGVPTWIMVMDGSPICPAGSMTCMGKECHACKGGKVWQCLLHRCTGDRFSDTLSTVLEHARLLRRGFARPTGFIVPSEYHQDMLIHAGTTGRPVLSADLPLNSAAFKAPGNVRKGYFLYVGSLANAKGIRTLIEATRLSINTMPIMIAGDSPERERLQEEIRETGMSDRIRFLGRLLPRSLRQVMEECDALIVPSQCEEIGPWSLLQAQAIGKPIIASDHSVLPCRILHGENGFLFQTGQPGDLAQYLDEMRDLSDDEYAAMCLSASEYAVEHYDPFAYAERILNILQNGAVSTDMPEAPYETEL